MKTLLTLLLLFVSVTFASAGDQIILFEEDDPAMNTAIHQARESLEGFFSHTTKHADKTALKVAFPTSSGGLEHIWVDNSARNGDRFTGTLANEPDDLGAWRNGSEVTFNHDQISDWGINIDGRGYGYFTVRVMLPRLDKESAAGLRAWLSEDPLPADWR